MQTTTKTYRNAAGATVTEEIIDFGVADEKGRRVGVIVRQCTGDYLYANVQMTRAGQRYGAAQHGRSCATEVERAAYIAKRVEDSRRVALKRFAPASKPSAATTQDNTTVKTKLTTADKSAPAANGRCFVVIGLYVWGKGQTIDEALKNASRPSRFVVYDTLAGAEVNGMGELCCASDEIEASVAAGKPPFVLAAEVGNVG